MEVPAAFLNGLLWCLNVHSLLMVFTVSLACFCTADVPRWNLPGRTGERAVIIVGESDLNISSSGGLGQVTFSLGLQFPWASQVGFSALLRWLGARVAGCRL